MAFTRAGKKEKSERERTEHIDTTEIEPRAVKTQIDQEKI